MGELVESTVNIAFFLEKVNSSGTFPYFFYVVKLQIKGRKRVSMPLSPKNANIPAFYISYGAWKMLTSCMVMVVL